MCGELFTRTVEPDINRGGGGDDDNNDGNDVGSSDLQTWEVQLGRPHTLSTNGECACNLADQLTGV